MNKTELATREFSFSYWFQGSAWSFTIWASSPEEALLKLNQLRNTATYDGEIMLTIPIPGVFRRILRWVMEPWRQ